MSSLRIGVVGFGTWSPNVTRNLAKHAQIAWVVDPSDAAQTRARDAGYVSRDAPDWSSCSAVYVSTPIATHETIVRNALLRGKHVLCEKPVGVSLEEAAALVETAKRERLTLMACHPWTAHRGVLRILGYGGYAAMRWAHDERGLDPLLDLLPHDASLIGIHRARALPDEVNADAGTGRQTRVFMRYGAKADNVSYRYDADEKVRIVATPLGRNDGALPEGAPEPLSEIAAAFVEACETGFAPRYGGPDEILYVARIIDAARKSRDLGGEWVKP